MQRQYTVQVSSVQEMVYRTLRDKIVSMELKPGTTISTQEIADSMSVSRTPVREAFIRLQREDLLDVTPQRSTVVSKINMDRVYQERFIREALDRGRAEIHRGGDARGACPHAAEHREAVRGDRGAALC